MSFFVHSIEYCLAAFWSAACQRFTQEKLAEEAIIQARRFHVVRLLSHEWYKGIFRRRESVQNGMGDLDHTLTMEWVYLDRKAK